MASRQGDDQAQMILLAGVLIVLAFILYSTQSLVVNPLGDEAGREAANPLLNDYQGIRNSIAGQLEFELWNAARVAVCPTDEADYRTRVQSKLVLLSRLEANRGQVFAGDFLDATIPATNLVGADPPRELQTRIQLYLTNGRSTIADQVVFITECTP